MDSQTGQTGQGNVVGRVPVLRVKPHLPLSLAYAALIVGVIIGVIFFALWFVRSATGLDIVETVTESVQQIIDSGESIGSLSPVISLLLQLQQSVAMIIIEAVITVFLLQLPVINLEVALQPDRLDYKSGLFLVKRKSTPLLRVVSANYRTYFPGVDFGVLQIALSGEQENSLEMPYVLHVKGVCSAISTAIAQSRVRTQPVQPPPQNAPPGQPARPTYQAYTPRQPQQGQSRQYRYSPRKV